VKKNNAQRQPVRPDAMDSQWDALRKHIGEGILTNLPQSKPIDSTVDHAPARRQILTSQEKKLALRNSLRYFDKDHHAELAVEFLHELNTFGRIIMNRFRPTEYDMKAHPLDA